METEFVLPSSLEDKYPDKTDVEVTFHGFKYAPEYIGVDYVYKLTWDQTNFFLQQILKKFANTENADALGFYLELNEGDKEDTFYKIQDYLDYRASKELKDKLMEHVKESAFEEFKISFEFWVDEDDRDDYLEREDFDI